MFGGGIIMVDKKHMLHKYSGEEHHTFTEWFNENLKTQNKKLKVECNKRSSRSKKSNNSKLFIELLFGD